MEIWQTNPRLTTIPLSERRISDLIDPKNSKATTYLLQSDCLDQNWA